MVIHRLLVKFAFDGRLFEGYARQPTGRTVEGELLDALRRAKVVTDVTNAAFASAGRVDRGVSAIAAAAAFDSPAPKENVMGSLNAALQDIIVHTKAEVDPGFDPRRRAVSRWYRYHFTESGLASGLDLSAMRRAARQFLGEHDFSPFAKADGRNPVREVLEISLDRGRGALVMDVQGRSFLWNQVRRMAGALELVGRGGLGPSDIQGTLETGKGGPFPTAPAEGLVLMDVRYPDVDFQSTWDFPRGSVDRIRERHYELGCSVRFMEYLRQRTRI